MALSKEERERIRLLVARLYTQGYAQGMAQVGNAYEIQGLVGRAALRMPDALEIRLDLVDKAVDEMLRRIETRAAALVQAGEAPAAIAADLSTFARNLAQNRANVISQTEFAQARFDGAGHLMDESGMTYEWRFPHFELATPGHEECPICRAIRERSPYTQEEAEAEGFPSVPHPNCDHGWVIVPVGEEAKAEEFPVPPLGTEEWPEEFRR